MRLINVDETYGIIASDNTDWTCTFSGGVITVADEAGFIHAEFLADDIPAVDAVPVVRCGGCEYSLSYCGYLVCSLSARSRNPKANYIVNPDFFCAHGKRKEAT